MNPDTPRGLALYLRHYTLGTHGTPAELMRRMADHGAAWVAIAGPWDDVNGLRYINTPTVCKRLSEAAVSAGMDPYIWGYPWQGREEAFVDALVKCATYPRFLLDPELGANPGRFASGDGKRLANASAAKLVNLVRAAHPDGVCGVSTFGSGVSMGWFPMNAFAQELAKTFGGRSFIGGQTYVDDAVVGKSMQAFASLCSRYAADGHIDLVPNFGTYTNTPSGVRPKTKEELDSHFLEFIDTPLEVNALIGWAENFMTPGLWRSFARMADRLDRGATVLPSTNLVPILQ